VATRTLAELYEKQGLVGRAREIYRQLAEQGDEEARRRLERLPAGAKGIQTLEALLERIAERKR
jgi:hypothetical protein